MTAERTLVAGIGNIFLRRRRLRVARSSGGCRSADLPAGVRVVDYGIRGMHLAYDLLDGCDALVVVDALPDRGAPGHLEVLEIRPQDLEGGDARRPRHGAGCRAGLAGSPRWRPAQGAADLVRFSISLARLVAGDVDRLAAQPGRHVPRARSPQVQRPGGSDRRARRRPRADSLIARLLCRVGRHFYADVGAFNDIYKQTLDRVIDAVGDGLQHLDLAGGATIPRTVCSNSEAFSS